MLINGLQKLTLLDFPGKTACTVFTGGCNMRCPFCYNVPLVLDPQIQPVIPADEVLSFLRKRQGLLDGVAFTGGEPTLQPDLADFIKAVRGLGFAVKLDTNGTHPEVLENLLGERLLDYIAMDIKASREDYPRVSGVPDIDISAIERSVRLLMECGIDYEFRTTVVRELHTEASMRGIGEWLHGAKRYYIQCFSDKHETVGDEALSAYSPDELDRLVKSVEPFIPSVRLRGVD